MSVAIGHWIRTAGLAIMLGLLGIGLASAPGEARPLTIAVQEAPPQLDPILFARNVAYRILPNIFDTLIVVDYQDHQKLKPGLATEWRRIDDRTLELKLRRGVKFHDGGELTAADVVFTFSPERIGKDKPGNAVYLQFLKSIEGVTAIDDYTVAIRTSAPDPVLELRLSGWGSQIVSKKAFDAIGGDWDKWSVRPIGSGPFAVKDYVANEKLVLQRFDDYWGPKANAEEITFVVVPEQAARISGFLAGDYDIITEVDIDQIATIEASDDGRVVGGTIRNHRIVGFDFDNPIMRDPRIRRALGLAIDRKLLVETIWQNKVEVGNGLQWPEFGPLYDAGRKPAAYDPELAKTLLSEAGYQGEVIPYRVRPNYYPAQLATAQALKSMWEAVGFRIDLQVKESWDQVYAEPGTGLYDSSVPPLFADPISGLWRNYGAGGNGKDHWKNEEFEELGKVLLSSLDPEERARAHSRMLDIWEGTDPAAVVLHALGQFYGLRSDIVWTPYNVAFMDLGGRNLSFAP